MRSCKLLGKLPSVVIYYVIRDASELKLEPGLCTSNTTYASYFLIYSEL